MADDPILELGEYPEINLTGTEADDIQFEESQEEDLLIELDGYGDIVLSDLLEDDIVLEDSYAGQITYDYYEGPYNVRPILYDAQELNTNQKIMLGNVTVEEIPITWTTNQYGGITAIIG